MPAVPAPSLSGPPFTRAARLELLPIKFRDAAAFVDLHHRQLGAPRGHLFSLACRTGHDVCGVAIVGRPVARNFDDGLTAELTRCCVLPDARNATSFLMAAAWRAARALGYRRLVTYTLPGESGASLRGAGWKLVGQTRGGEWSCPSRYRARVRHPEAKTLWEASGLENPGQTSGTQEQPDQLETVPVTADARSPA